MKYVVMTLSLMSLSQAALAQLKPLPKEEVLRIIRKPDVVRDVKREGQAPAPGRDSVREVPTGGSGSGIGGGHLYSSIINWCDDTSILLDEAEGEAMDLWSLGNDKVGAIRTMYEGLLAALSGISTEEINFNSSVTFKVISRGIALAQRLGVPQIINGQFGQVKDEKGLLEILSFMKFYYGFVKETSEHLDKKYYVPYYSRTSCRGCEGLPVVQTLELEKEMVSYSINQLGKWRTHFIRAKSNGEGVYPTAEVVTFLSGLSYLSQETAADLKEGLFAKAYECQSKRLVNLSKKIQFYVSSRSNASLDGIKLNQFVLASDEILKSIRSKSCH